MASRLAAQYAGHRDVAPEGIARIPRGDPARDQPRHQPRRPGDRAPDPAKAGAPMSAAANPLMSGGRRARRRKRTGQVMEALATAAALLAAAALAIVLITVAKRGLPALNVDFFTQNAAPFGAIGRRDRERDRRHAHHHGHRHRDRASRRASCSRSSTPSSLRGGVADAIGLTLNVLAGVPTIVIGVFIFALVVVGRGQSAFAGALGLSIVMLPLVARAIRGGASPGAVAPARGWDGARSDPGAHGADGDPADRRRRDRDGDDRRRRPGRGRDRAAAVHDARSS